MRYRRFWQAEGWKLMPLTSRLERGPAQSMADTGSGESVMGGSYSISVVTSLEDRESIEEQRAIADKYLAKLNFHFELVSQTANDVRRGVQGHLASGFELIEITLSSSTIFNALILGAAAGTGLAIGKLFGKVLDSAAGELGKDLYAWLKELVLAGIRKSKHKNLNVSAGEPEKALILLFHVVLYEDTSTPITLRVYVRHEFGKWNATTRTLVDNGLTDDIFFTRLKELTDIVIPVVSGLLEKQRGGNARPPDRVILELYVDPEDPARHDWAMNLGFMTLGLSQTKELTLRFLDKDSAVTVADVRRMHDRIVNQIRK